MTAQGWTLDELRDLCLDISFQGEDLIEWYLAVEEEASAFWMQWQFYARDSETGERTRQTGWKWRVSKYSTADEVVKTAWLAALQAVEHEARERFRYKGAAIFHPHTDVEALVEMQRAKRRVTRKEPARREQAD